MNNFTKRLAISTVAAGTLLATAFAPGAFAADPTTATVTGGSLTISDPQAAVFEVRPITGEAQTTTAALEAFTVSDLTGSGAGWSVTAQAGQFLGASHDLVLGSLSVSEPTPSSESLTSAAPIATAGAFIDDAGDGVVIATAAANAGMGIWDFTATTLTLALPADVFADVYSSTVTISLVIGP